MRRTKLAIETKNAIFNTENKSIQHIDFAFEIKQISETDDYYEFEGYGSTFNNVDRVNDVVLKGAFVESLTKQTPVLLWQHEMKMPLGIFVELREDEIGLFVKGRMPKTDTFVSGRVVPQMKIGSVTKMSIGFTTESKSDYEKKNGVRYLKRVQLWEISLVTIPANPNADVTTIKNLTIEGKELSFSEISQQLRVELTNYFSSKFNNDEFYTWCHEIYPNKCIFELERKGFKPESYQVNYIYNPNDDSVTLNGEPFKVKQIWVPVNTNEEEINTKQFTINDVFCIKTKRELEKLLRDSGVFTKKAAIYISSFLQETQSDSGKMKNDKTAGLISQLKSFQNELEKK